MLTTLLVALMLGQTPPQPPVPIEKAWHTASNGVAYWGWLHNDTIHFDPAEQPRRPPRPSDIRWWVQSAPPGYDAAQMEIIIHEAAHRWHVADVQIAKATSESDANLLIVCVDMVEQYQGLTELGGPEYLRGGNRAFLRINSKFRLGRKHLLALTIHEIGHALGLNHHEAGSVMEPFLYGTTELSEQDRSAIFHLYGRRGTPR